MASAQFLAIRFWTRSKKLRQSPAESLVGESNDEIDPSNPSDEYYVLDTTGPGLVSRTLAEYPGARDQVEVLFPKDVCDRDSWYSFGSYGVHLQMGRWRPRKGVALKFLCNRWESRGAKRF